MKSWKTISDVTREEWVELDFELEKCDKADMPYDIIGCKLLAFILHQIYQDAANFMEVPDFIHKGPQFQELAVLYNKSLRPILFPTRKEITVKDAMFVRKITGLGVHECKKILEEYDSIVDAVNDLRKNSDEPQYDGLTEWRVDVLDKNNNVIFTCKTMNEVRQAGYCPLNYRIRGVDCVGRYTYVK